MVERVKTEIRNLLMPKGRAPLRFSLAIDGGSSNLANGAKLITVLVLSPELPCELVLGIELRTTHEDAVSQAELLEKLLTEFGLKSADVVYLVGDNVAVNKATVDLLRCEWDWPSSCSPGSIRMCQSSQYPLSVSVPLAMQPTRTSGRTSSTCAASRTASTSS